MPIHVVQQGECMSSLAARYGLSSWKDLYHHPDNADLRKKRPNPNVLAPGDEVVVPPITPKWATCKTEQTHRFVVKLPKVKLRLFLRNWRGEPYEGKKFVVTVGTKDLEGTTQPGGRIEVEVPATATAAQLRVWLSDDPEPEIERDLAIGHLDPIELISGVQARLANLGYPCSVSGEIDEATLVAARIFRARSGLPAVAIPGSSDEGADADAAAPRDMTEYAEKLMDRAFRERLLAAYESKEHG